MRFFVVDFLFVTVEEIFRKLDIKKDDFDDLHITRNFSSFVAVSHGKVIAMTAPVMTHCPLFSMLYRVDPGQSPHDVREAIRKSTESKIAQFGSFTERRELSREDIAVPYGASEMMMTALRKGVIDATVTACDGAGSVIATSPGLVQGIGARMNGLFYTTPLRQVIAGVRGRGGIVVFPETAEIDQVRALEHAVWAGFKKLAVTINGFTDEDASRVREMEKRYAIRVTVIFVCTTGVEKKRVAHMAKYGDVVWSCASGPVREIIGRRSVLQITTGIPVFVLTAKGLEFVSAYSPEPCVITGLDVRKQYLISGYVKGLRIRMGEMETYLSKAVLPVRSDREPR